MAAFRYLNINPNGENRNDCVTRAISLASGLPYAEIRRKLRNTASLLDCESSLCPTCYGFLIQEVLGGVLKDCNGMTVEEFADRNPKGTYLLRINSHLTTLCDGTIYDTWDCRKRECLIAWRVA